MVFFPPLALQTYSVKVYVIWITLSQSALLNFVCYLMSLPYIYIFNKLWAKCPVVTVPENMWDLVSGNVNFDIQLRKAICKWKVIIIIRYLYVYVKENDALQKINVYWLPYCFCYTFNRLKFWDCSLQFWERAFLTCKQPRKLAWLKEYYADSHRKEKL